MNKYIISFSNLQHIDSKDIDNFCNKNLEWIKGIYIHPPFGEFYDWHQMANCGITNEHKQEIKDQISIAKKYNIPIHVTFNQKNQIKKDYFENYFLNDVKNYINEYGKPDYIITFDKFAPILKANFPDIKLVRSVNEGINNKIENEYFKFYDIVALGGLSIYDVNFMKQLKNKYPNIEIEILYCGPYFSCIPQCFAHCSRCLEVFKFYTNKLGMNWQLAHRVTMAKELKLISPYIDYIKLYPNFLERLLDHYNRCEYDSHSMYEIIKAQYEGWMMEKDGNDKRDYINSLNYKFNEENYNEIIKIKNEAWTEALGYPIDLNKL